ncbi:MAG TPA: VOC family protein [Chitinophagaceae bacterium]|jgi:hypothetical protein|nr:VOC family protein [Chitinophagaceae bacterium]
MELRLLVIRTPDPPALAEFYSLLGFQFQYHKHGNSPYHYSATIGSCVLEIYPLSKEQTTADNHLRLGFAMERFDAIIYLLKEKQVPFITEPSDTDYGIMAVIEDPDKRKIELYKK